MSWNVDELSEEDKQRLVRFLEPFFHSRAPDSTENAGKWGVRSIEPGKTPETEGFVLTATGAGGSTWSKVSSGLVSYSDCTLADSSLVYFWPCQEASGNVVDVKGSGFDGVPDTFVVSSTTYPTYRNVGPFVTDFSVGFAGTGGVGGADDRFDFSGSSTIFNTLKNDLPFTIDVWMYPTSNTAGRLFEYWGGTIDQWIFIERDASGFVSFTRTNGGAGGASAPSTLNTWTHVRVAHDGTLCYVYLNGVLMDSSASSTTNLTNTGGMALGNARNTGGSGYLPFQGRLAYLSIRNAFTDTFCPVVGAGGPLVAGASAGMVLTADGSGSTYWAYPTIEVEY